MQKNLFFKLDKKVPFYLVVSKMSKSNKNIRVSLLKNNQNKLTEILFVSEASIGKVKEQLVTEINNRFPNSIEHLSLEKTEVIPGVRWKNKSGLTDRECVKVRKYESDDLKNFLHQKQFILQPA